MEFFVVAARFTRFGALKIDQFNNIKFDQRIFFVFLGLVGVQTISNSLPPKASSRIREFPKKRTKSQFQFMCKALFIFPPCVSEILTPFHIIKVENTSEIFPAHFRCKNRIKWIMFACGACYYKILLIQSLLCCIILLFSTYLVCTMKLECQQIVNLAYKTTRQSAKVHLCPSKLHQQTNHTGDQLLNANIFQPNAQIFSIKLNIAPPNHDARNKNIIVRTLWSRKFINLKGHGTYSNCSDIWFPLPSHSSRTYLRNVPDKSLRCKLSCWVCNPAKQQQSEIVWKTLGGEAFMSWKFQSFCVELRLVI